MNEQTWWKDDAVWVRAKNSAASVVYGAKEAAAAAYNQDEFKIYLKEFNEFKHINTFSNAGEWVNAFKGWYLSGGHLFFSMVENALVNVERSYTLPDGSQIKIGVAANFSVPNHGMMDRLIDQLASMIDSQHSRLLAKNYGGYEVPKFQPLPVNQGNPAKQLKSDQQVIPIIEFRVLHDGKQKMVKAIGGEFTGYGIPVYAEQLKAIGMDIEKMEVGKVYPCGKSAIVRMKDSDHPQKVVGWWD